MRLRLLFAAAASVVVLASAGCSSSGSSERAASTPSTTESANESAAEDVASEGDAESEGGDFCTLYATKVAQGLVNIHEAEAGGIVAAEGIADELAKQGQVSQDQLQAVAPPEPLGYLQAVEAADAAGASGDFSALDGVTDNLAALNLWAVNNCGDKYRPVFEEYQTIIG